MKLLILLVNLAIVYSSQLNCPDGTLGDPLLGLCYLFNTVSADFLEAEGYCNSRGGHLASVRNARENTLIAADARNQNISGSIWIGLTSLMSNDKAWQWIDNSAVTYTNWRGNDTPIPDYSISCAQMQDSFGDWSAQDCNERLPFVCTIPANNSPMISTDMPKIFTTTPRLATTSNRATSPFLFTTLSRISTTSQTPKSTVPPVTCEQGWTAFNGSCYQAVQYDGMIYGEKGFQLCKSLRAQMASIHSQEENDMIAQLATTYGEFTLIGLSRMNETDFRWIDSSDWDYSNWSRAQPTDYNEAVWGMMYAGRYGLYEFGTWAEATSGTICATVICKKPPMIPYG